MINLDLTRDQGHLLIMALTEQMQALCVKGDSSLDERLADCRELRASIQEQMR